MSEEKQNTLERLRELRDVLHGELSTAGAANIGRISSEYTKTILEIDRLERESGSGSRLASIIGGLSGK